MKNVPINETDVKAYFSFLDSCGVNEENSTIQTVCFLDEHSKNVVKGYGVKFGTVSEVLGICNELGSNYTLHSCLNLTNLKGRQTQHINRVRVLCVDIDTLKSNEEIKKLVEEYDIGMVVESSPGKFHLYWHFDCNLEQWRIYQLSVSYKLGGDLNLDQLSKTIRVPGISRIGKDGAQFMPVIKYLNYQSKRITDTNIIEKFPWLMESYKEGLAFKEEDKKRVRSELKKARKVAPSKATASGITAAISGIDAPLMGRNTALYSEVRDEVIEGQLCIEEAQEAGMAINGHFKEPLGEDEVVKTVNSAFRSASQAIEAREERIQEEKAKLEAVCKGFPYNYSVRDLRTNRFTDMAFVERMVQKFRHWAFEVSGVLYAFDEVKSLWVLQKPTCSILHKFALNVAHDIINDEKFIDECCTTSKGEFSSTLLIREQNKWLNANKHSAVIHLFKNHIAIPRKDLSECDSNSYLFYCINGVVNLLTGEIRDAKAEDYLLKQSNITYDKEAVCPFWEEFIHEIFAENPTPDEMVAFIQEVFGYTLTGDIGEQCIYIHEGDGANGKSMVLSALQMLLGEYANIIEPHVLSSNSNALNKEFSRLGVQLEGKRGVIIDDLNTRTQWDECLVKNLTSKTITARQLYTEQRAIPNRAKIHIGCNETPSTDAGGHAVLRRLCIIDYCRTFEVSLEKYQQIEKMVEQELPGIFNWALKGLWRTRENKKGVIKRPMEVMIAAEDYEASSFDVTDVFDKLFTQPNEAEIEQCWMSVTEITDVLNSYLISVGKRDKQISVDALGKKLSKHGFHQKRERILGNRKKLRFYSVKLLSTLL